MLWQSQDTWNALGADCLGQPPATLAALEVPCNDSIATVELTALEDRRVVHTDTGGWVVHTDTGGWVVHTDTGGWVVHTDTGAWVVHTHTGGWVVHTHTGRWTGAAPGDHQSQAVEQTKAEVGRWEGANVD